MSTKPGEVPEKPAEAEDPVEGMPAIPMGDYALEKELGRGGMGVVYLARHTRTSMLHAVKVVLSRIAARKAARHMFQREIEVLRGLSHPNIITFQGSGSSGDAYYFVMEYCRAGGLDRQIKKHGGKIPLKLALPVMRHTLKGLAHAHGMNFVHRDLKPSNILLGDKGGRAVAKLADFGLAKSFSEAGLSGMTITGAVGGSVHFMPREQVINFKYSRPAGDVWSLGATYYMMLTGTNPRNFGPDEDPIQVILKDEIVPIEKRDHSLPRFLVDAINQSLASKPEERFPSASEFLEALDRAM